MLGGAKVPAASVKKWVGIVWDRELSFLPFLQARTQATWLASKPLAALARDGLAPLAEIGDAMACKVESALFYGAMFFFLADGAAGQLDVMQVEMERSLLGAPKWLSAVHVRSVGGWSLTWGERLLYEALVFRAELWCCSSEMLVRSAWESAQHFPGKTFASVSQEALKSVGFAEIFSFEGWGNFIAHGVPVLPIYKAALRERLVVDSVARWRASMASMGAIVPSLLSQQFPCSAGGRLLDGGYMEVLLQADQWDLLRLGVGAAACLSQGRGGNHLCKLCGVSFPGMSHILSSCSVLVGERNRFLSQVGGFYSSKLLSAPSGDWATLVLSPHADLVFLQHAVVFGAAVMDALKKA